jgi:Spy/CpxP family protein refolding chaperone
MHRTRLVLLTVLFGVLPIGQNAFSQSDNSVVASIKNNQGRYFTSRIDNLTEQLSLTPDQQRRMRPILEQEVGYLEQIRGNPVLSKKEKVKRLQTIVQGSDNQMKSFLSEEQWQKLQGLRKGQKAELKKYAETK